VTNDFDLPFIYKLGKRKSPQLDLVRFHGAILPGQATQLVRSSREPQPKKTSSRSWTVTTNSLGMLYSPGMLSCIDGDTPQTVWACFTVMLSCIGEYLKKAGAHALEGP